MVGGCGCPCPTGVSYDAGYAAGGGPLRCAAVEAARQLREDTLTRARRVSGHNHPSDDRAYLWHTPVQMPKPDLATRGLAPCPRSGCRSTTTVTGRYARWTVAIIRAGLTSIARLRPLLSPPSHEGVGPGSTTKPLWDGETVVDRLRVARIVHCLRRLGVIVAHIFISYATPDRVIADEVSSWLRAAGHDPFLDHDLRDGIGVGEDWKQRLYRELRQVDAVIGVVTSSFVASNWCSAELGIADAHDANESSATPLPS